MNRADGLICHGSGFVFREPGDAEIRHLNGAVLQKHDILRLYIPVDNPFFMGVLKRRQDLAGKMHRFLPLDIVLALDIILQGDAVDILHDDILDPVAEADIVHLDDIRVGQHRDGLGLVFKPAHKFLVAKEFVLQNLNRHHTVVDRVVRFIDIRHSANAQKVSDLIPAIQPFSGIFIHGKSSPILVTCLW